MTRLLFPALLAALLTGCGGSEPVVSVDAQAIEPPTGPAPETMADEAEDRAAAAMRADDNVPVWAADAVFYQLFPERFRNGDPTNDPTRASLETPLDRVPENWEVTPWTADWYARADWEEARGDDFYELSGTSWSVGLRFRLR